ncbi:MAG TPA: hypothetical protein P5057_07960 [Acidobacteriota bacterium]|nr:hypothetical protein [Acidobacteriota bacterium]
MLALLKLTVLGTMHRLEPLREAANGKRVLDFRFQVSGMGLRSLVGRDVMVQ